MFIIINLVLVFYDTVKFFSYTSNIYFIYLVFIPLKNIFVRLNPLKFFFLIKYIEQLNMNTRPAPRTLNLTLNEDIYKSQFYTSDADKLIRKLKAEQDLKTYRENQKKEFFNIRQNQTKQQKQEQKQQQKIIKQQQKQQQKEEIKKINKEFKEKTKKERQPRKKREPVKRENKKDNKDIIIKGNLIYDYKQYEEKNLIKYIWDKYFSDLVYIYNYDINKMTVEEVELFQKKYDEELEKLILYEKSKGYIYYDNFFYNNEYEIWISKLTKDEREKIDENIKKTSNTILKKTSIKGGFDKKLYYFQIYNNTYYDYNYKKKYYNLFLINVIQSYINNYDFLVFIKEDYINNKINNIEKKQLKEIKMKDAYSYNIEGYENQEWETNKGRCVFDYIKFKYGNLKGLKLACNDDELIKIFDDDNVLINGVNTYQINNFCKTYNIALYAYDENEKLFHHYYPDKKNNYPSMMFKILNNHFYPIPENKRRSLINNKNGLNIYSNLYNDDNNKKEEINNEIITLNENDNIFSKLSNIMKENKKIPNVRMYDDNITSIKINDNNYIFRDSDDMIKKIINNMNIEYKGQTITEIISIIIKDKINISSPNITVYNDLLKAKKNRAFNGLIKNKKIDENDNLIAYDINKCYSSILYNPIEEWLLLDVNNDWEDYNNNDDIKLGLYSIETDDNLLFKGNNIYSSSIVKKAIEENIKFRIIKVLYADKKQCKNLFVDIIDDILKITNNDMTLYKLMINCISGMMGKNKMKYTKAHINSSLEHIFSTIDNYKKEDENINAFIKNIDEKYYLYGFSKDIKLYDVNIPMYIQILDQSNIKLYDMIKKADGELIGRKVDCAIIKNPKNKLELGNKWGDYRISIIPTINNYDINNDITYTQEREVKIYNNIIDSNDYEKILNICINKKGCLMTGDAGTGKSYVIHKITEILGNEKVIKITPTNKSALNIKGQTIHRFLKLNKDGKIPRKTIEKIKNMKLDLIIIDEISMINKDLWKLILLLKEETQYNFLLIGDDKQLPPIEDDGIEREYFNSSVVKYISNYNKINLEVKKRYDENLSQILEDVENINKNDFKNKIETKFNICYFNNTRKRINAYWNNKEKNNNSILIKADENDEITQDIYLYKGLPLIARKNLKGGEETINNEKFILDNYDNQYLFLSSDRPDDNGEIFKHKIDIDIKDLQKLFCLNYCSTTHKSQGETISENFTIYDFNFMSKKCKYTALSRAKKAEQIIINGEII